MNSTYGDMAYVLYLTAQEPAQEMSELTEKQKLLMDERKAFRELKKMAQDALNSNGQGGPEKELLRSELRALRAEAVKLGVDVTEIDTLIATTEKDYNGHDVGNGDRRIHVGGETDYGKERADLFAKFESKWNEGIKEKITELSDQDDQIAFQLQVLFNKYSTRMGMATSTVQNDKQNSQQITQKL